MSDLSDRSDMTDRTHQDGWRYKGWPNVETWLVYTWLTSEANATGDCRAIARDACVANAAGQSEAIARVAEALQAYVEEESPLLDVAGLYADLVVAALGQVLWEAIARHVIAAER